MTTETINNDSIETSEPTEIKEPRKLSILLSLDTYQGMTDEEIQSIIDFKVKESMMSVEANSFRLAAQENMEYNRECCDNSLQNVKDVLQSILQGTTHYVEPKLETVTE